MFEVAYLEFQNLDAMAMTKMSKEDQVNTTGQRGDIRRDKMKRGREDERDMIKGAKPNGVEKMSMSCTKGQGETE